MGLKPHLQAKVGIIPLRIMQAVKQLSLLVHLLQVQRQVQMLLSQLQHLLTISPQIHLLNHQPQQMQSQLQLTL